MLRAAVERRIDAQAERALGSPRHRGVHPHLIAKAAAEASFEHTTSRSAQRVRTVPRYDEVISHTPSQTLNRLRFAVAGLAAEFSRMQTQRSTQQSELDAVRVAYNKAR